MAAPAVDALHVRDFLRDQAGFDYIVTLTEEKATQERIGRLMEQEFPATLRPNDRFLFYFSGHGATRPLGAGLRGYLVLKSAGINQWDQMVGMPRIRDWAENVALARHTLFLLDACSSGLAAFQAKGNDVRERTIERLSQSGHHIITAGVDQEESYSYNGASLFTSAFLAAASGQIDPPQGGVISLDDIMIRIDRKIDEYRARFGENIKMTPHLYLDRIENNAGEFFFIVPTVPSPNRNPEAAGSSVSLDSKGTPHASAANSQPGPAPPPDDQEQLTPGIPTHLNPLQFGPDVETGLIRFGDRVFFAKRSNLLSEPAINILKRQVEVLRGFPDATITVEGHADENETSSRGAALALGEMRADAVKKTLVALGVASSRIQTISYGKERPAVAGDNEAAYAQNRRAVAVAN